MLHCPRNIMRTVAYSGLFLATGLALRPWRRIRPATGGWRTVSPTSVSPNAMAACGARCRGRRPRAAATSNNPDVSKQSRPTLGMPILIDMKKKPGVDQWEGQVYNAKDGQFYSSTIRPIGSDQLEIQGLRAGLSLRRRNLDPRRRPDTLEPGQQHGQGRAEDHGCVTQDRTAPKTHRHPATRPPKPPVKSRRGRASGRSGRRYLSTPRHRAVCPLAPAGTATPRPAS